MITWFLFDDERDQQAIGTFEFNELMAAIEHKRLLNLDPDWNFRVVGFMHKWDRAAL